ncbi:DUF551 domain-containing protein [Yersinia enterocolitica]
MKALDSFTVERLEEITELKTLSFPPSHAESAALARIALAAKRAEPVTWWTGPEPTKTGELESYHDHETGSHYLPLVVSLSAYNTTPQLNSPEIPDSWKLVPIEPTQNMVDAHISGMQLAGFSRAYRGMLAAAPEPQTQQQNIPEIIPQGWIKCSDQMPENDEFVRIWPFLILGLSFMSGSTLNSIRMARGGLLRCTSTITALSFIPSP